MPANLENSAEATGLENVTFHLNPKEGQYQRMFKLPDNCTHFTSQQVMLKIPQSRLQKYINQEITDVQFGFRKGRGTKDQTANICWLIKKARVSEKPLLLLH